MKNKTLYSVILLASCMLANLSAEMTVLDDFSSDATVTNYNGYTTSSNTTLTWTATGGALETYGPATIGYRYGGFQWNAGDTLDPGETVSVGIRLGTNYTSFSNSVAMGIRLSPTLFGTALTEGNHNTAQIAAASVPADSYFAYYYYETDAAAPGFYFSTNSGAPGGLDFIPNKYDSPNAVKLTQGEAPEDASADFVTLQLTRGIGVDQNVITWSFAGYFASDTGTFTVAGITDTDPLYFGVDQFNTYSSGYAFDNLSLGTIPESSSTTLCLGLVSLCLLFGAKYRTRFVRKA